MNKVATRLLEKSIPVTESGCWLWLEHTEHGGYGMIWHNGKKVLAHRLSYQTFIGPIPEGKLLDHLCRVRPCINPQHLEPVTTKVNVHRGDGVASLNIKKTHCKKGHEFTEANTYITSRNYRACRECGREACRDLYARTKEAL